VQALIAVRPPALLPVYGAARSMIICKSFADNFRNVPPPMSQITRRVGASVRKEMIWFSTCSASTSPRTWKFVMPSAADVLLEIVPILPQGSAIMSAHNVITSTALATMDVELYASSRAMKSANDPVSKTGGSSFGEESAA
jgi:hypothetical protein